MKNLFIFFIILLFSTAGNTDIKGSVLSKTSDKISEYTIGLIPGEGYTEASIDLREGFKPDYSILAVRELLKIDSGKISRPFVLNQSLFIIKDNSIIKLD